VLTLCKLGFPLVAAKPCLINTYKNFAGNPSRIDPPTKNASPERPSRTKRALRNGLSTFRMNTYKKTPVSAFRMNTCGAKDLKYLCFQHLRKKGRGWVVIVNCTSDEACPSRTFLFALVRMISLTLRRTTPDIHRRRPRTSASLPHSLIASLLPRFPAAKLTGSAYKELSHV